MPTVFHFPVTAFSYMCGFKCLLDGRSTSVQRGLCCLWRLLQLFQHGLNKSLEQGYQSVSWGQAARWRHVDEGCPPLTVIQWAIICKIAQVPKRRHKQLLYLIFSSVCCRCRNMRIPASVSGINHIHPCSSEVLADCSHVNDRVQPLWPPFDAAVTLRAEAADVSVSVATVLPCLLQNHRAGASGQTQMYSKLKETHRSADRVIHRLLLYVTRFFFFKYIG